MFKNIFLFVFLIYGFLINPIRSNSEENITPAVYCSDLNPQNSLDLDQIMGMWFGSEILTHNEVKEEGVFYYNSCIVVHIADITDQMSSTEVYSRKPESYRQRKYLRLIWEESGTILEYTLRYNDSRRGFWISSSPQKGTMLDLPYNQFSGTIQVMKAVGNHLVLSFCHNIPGSQLFTVILSRQRNALTFEELQGIRNLLKRRGLPTTSVRKACNNHSSIIVLPSVFIFIILQLLLY